MPARPRFNSTALMLLDPTSRPTMDCFPNMSHPSELRRRYRARLGFLPFSRSARHALALHPGIEHGAFELPPVAQLESRNPFLVHILVERVRAHAEILRGLANVHHFRRFGHKALPFFCTRPPPAPEAFSRKPFLTGASSRHRQQGVGCLLLRLFQPESQE